MYKISQFSKISGLTVKALRYYDQEDVLKPTLRNEQNQYRYYSDTDLQKAQLIKFLRSLNFSIMEIKDVVENVQNEDDFAFILQEKIKLIEDNISKERALIQQININTASLNQHQIKNTYHIDTVVIEEQLVASIRFTVQYQQLDNYVPLLYKTVKNNKCGKHFNCYYNEGYVEEADIELCIPVKKSHVKNVLTYKKIPKIKALRITHRGRYETLYLAYQFLFDYVNEHHIEILTPTREVYLKGPGIIFKGNPDHYITEILLPFEMY